MFDEVGGYFIIVVWSVVGGECEFLIELFGIEMWECCDGGCDLFCDCLVVGMYFGFVVMEDGECGEDDCCEDCRYVIVGGDVVDECE